MKHSKNTDTLLLLFWTFDNGLTLTCDLDLWVFKNLLSGAVNYGQWTCDPVLALVQWFVIHPTPPLPVLILLPSP